MTTSRRIDPVIWNGMTTKERYEHIVKSARKAGERAVRRQPQGESQSTRESRLRMARRRMWRRKALENGGFFDDLALDARERQYQKSKMEQEDERKVALAKRQAAQQEQTLVAISIGNKMEEKIRERGQRSAKERQIIIQEQASQLVKMGYVCPLVDDESAPDIAPSKKCRAVSPQCGSGDGIIIRSLRYYR
jgi:hypothetical protein